MEERTCWGSRISRERYEELASQDGVDVISLSITTQERGFFNQKGSRRGMSVKEKDLNRNLKNTSSGIGVSTDSDDTMNVDTPRDGASAVPEGVTPSLVDMTGEVLLLCLTLIQLTCACNHWGRSSYARVMIKLRADVELKDNIVVAMPKITREGHYTCNVHVEYEWKPLRCSSCKVFGHIHEECLKNIGAGEKKTVKKPSQTSR
ncbi:hypothetical protein Tco_1418370 [Tanacetum coccineum]